MSDKESAEAFAQIAESKGYQTISFDLPEHGERKNQGYRCDIWNGISDLHQISSYTFANWNFVSLFACSLGAYFSLQAYKNITFEKCLFLSPIVNMAVSYTHLDVYKRQGLEVYAEGNGHR